MADPDADLIAELRALGRSLPVPEAADQRAAVRARLAGPARKPRVRGLRWPSASLSLRWPSLFRGRRWVAALVATVVATVLVVPPARAAVADAAVSMLRIAGVEVRREPTPDPPAAQPGPPAAQPGPPAAQPGPPAAQPSPLPSSRGATLAEARALAPFTVLSPAGLGEPEQVLLADSDPAGTPRVVTLVYRGGALRLDQFAGGLDPVFRKSAPDGEYTQIGGQTAIWLPRPHPLSYVDRNGTARTEVARLAGPALVWSTGEVTYRLEGVATIAEARDIAGTLR